MQPGCLAAPPWRWTASVFSRAVHQRVTSHPNITVVREEVTELPSPGIVATGPLTSERLTARRWSARLGSSALAFYDAIAPVVSADSLDHEPALRAVAVWKGRGQRLPQRPDGRGLVRPLHRCADGGDQFQGHEFDEVPYFEGCLPVEEMARRGRETLRFGPMKPVGLADPRTGREPHAVVQLRREDRAGQMWNLVGFQTRLRIPEQQRVFRMIPGLESAEFLRFGSIHRNSYLNSPASLGPALTARDDVSAFFRGPDHRRRGLHRVAGDRAHGRASTWHAGFRANRSRCRRQQRCWAGCIATCAEADPKHFQPMNANFGLLDPLPGKVKKDRKKELLVERAQADFTAWLEESSIQKEAISRR